MKTANAKNNEIEAHWWLIDASNHSLGRLSTRVANLLRGKNKPRFTPHVDTGDFVVVINSKHIRLTGRKWNNKKYYSHSGFFGSLKTKTAKDLATSDIINRAVYGMLPKNPTRDKLIKKLKIYETAEHPHTAQKPMSFTINEQTLVTKDKSTPENSKKDTPE